MIPMKRKLRSTSKKDKVDIISKDGQKDESNYESNNEEIDDENDNSSSSDKEAENDADNEDDDSEDDDSENEDDDNSSNNDEEEDNIGDGFGNVMQKILNQNVGRKVPVLSKRKTAAMKKLTEDLESKREVKKTRIQRLTEKGKQEIIPDITSNDRERQLKRIATRGVVALFNAISKAKRDDTSTNGSTSNIKQDKSGKGSKESAAEFSGQEIKRMTQENFLAMLKNSDGTKEQSEQNRNNSTSNTYTNERTIEKKNDSDSDEEDEEEAKGGRGWKVFNQDLYTDATLNKVSSTSLKGWDREDSDSADSEDEERLPDPFEEALEEKREEGLSKKKRIQNLKAKAKKAKADRA